MHLIFSSLITEKRFSIHKGSELTQSPRPNFALTTIRGLQKLPISSADIFLSFDETTSWAKEALIREIEGWGIQLRFHAKRLESFSEWKELSDSLISDFGPTKTLLLMTNDDHVMLDAGLDRINTDISQFIEYSALFSEDGNTLMLPLSHYPEIRGLVEIARNAMALKQIDDRKIVPCQIPAVPMLVRASEFASFFTSDFTQGARLVGLENPFGPSLRLHNGYYLVPTDEILRHADGYGHIGLTKWPVQAVAPSVEITANGIIEHPYQAFPPSVSEKETLTRGFASDSALPTTITGHSAILRASALRFPLHSWSEILNSQGVKKRRLAHLMGIILVDAGLARKVLKYLAVVPITFPMVLLLGLLSKSRRKIGTWALHFLTYGSSIGYTKMMYIMIAGRIRLRRTNPRA